MPNNINILWILVLTFDQQELVPYATSTLHKRNHYLPEVKQRIAPLALAEHLKGSEAESHCAHISSSTPLRCPVNTPSLV